MSENIPILNQDEIDEIERSVTELESGPFAAWLRHLTRLESVPKLARKYVKKLPPLKAAVQQLEDRVAALKGRLEASQALVDDWESKAAEAAAAEAEHRRVKTELALFAQDRDVVAGEITELEAQKVALAAEIQQLLGAKSALQRR
jgi:chromosome segregation ATPase